MSPDIKTSADGYKSRDHLIRELNELRVRLSAIGEDMGRARREKEEARDDALEWFEAIFENTPLVAIQGFDRDGVIAHWNKASTQLYGYGTGEAIGRRLQDLLLRGDWAAEFEEGIKAVWDTGRPAPQREWEVWDREGNRHCVISTLFPVLVQGSVSELFCMDMDITDRLKAEEELQRAHDGLELRVRERTEDLKRTNDLLRFERSQLLSIFDSIDEVVYVSDPRTYEIIYANRAMKERFKKRLAGGKCYREIMGKASPCEFCTNDIILAEKGRPHRWEMYNPMVDRHYMVTDRIIKWPDGRDVRFEIAIDITDRKLGEEALMRAKSEAELYVDLMGHDINNMNQVGIGYLELAVDTLGRQGSLAEGDRFMLAKALESFNNSSRLIDNVRKIQREKQGGYEVEIVDVDRMLSDIISMYSSMAERMVRINYVPVPGCHVRANELIKDVFINLIGNAIKHSSGPVTIDIRLEKARPGGRRYHKICVEDDGPGIPDDLKRTLFDRLNLVTTRARGKGFGLCLIKMLVDDYGGMFWAEDRVPGDYGRGAKFVVMLPAAEKS